MGLILPYAIEPVLQVVALGLLSVGLMKQHRIIMGIAQTAHIFSGETSFQSMSIYSITHFVCRTDCNAVGDIKYVKGKYKSVC